METYSKQSLTEYRMHEHIRMRPAMYIGQIGSSGLSYLLGDLILDSVTDFKAKEIRIDLQKSGKIIFSLRKADIDRDFLKKMLEGKLAGSHHSFSLVACVALSASFMITAARKKYKVNANGAARPAMKGAAGAVYREMTLTFSPDQKLFGDTGPEGLMFYQRMSEVALTNPDVKIILRSDYTKPFTQIVAHCPKGVQHLLDLESSRRAGADFEHCVDFNEGGVRGQVGWFYPSHRYAPGSDAMMAFANGRSMRNGGSHVEGALEGIRDAVAGKVAGRKEEYYLEMSRVASRLCLVVSVWGHDFRYAGSTKECLEHEPSKTVVRKVVKEKLEKWMRASPKEAEQFLKLFLKDWPFANPLEQIMKAKK